MARSTSQRLAGASIPRRGPAFQDWLRGASSSIRGQLRFAYMGRGPIPRAGHWMPPLGSWPML